VELAEDRPYLQQSVVLLIRISSASSLATANPEMPRSSEVIFKRLEDPITSIDTQSGSREVVTEFRYALTPLSEGRITLPPIRMTGTYSAGGRSFEASAPSPLQLTVLPPDPRVQPWLPLHGLVLQAYIENAEEPEAGKPLNLVADISAVGATGSQLPSMESRLKSEDFRIYREKNETEGKVSGDRRFLLGRRTETFTLVPLHGGRVRIPELAITWWNVDTGKVETARVPIRQLVAEGDPGSAAGQIGDLFPGATSLLLWTPLIALFGLTIGFWILAWLRHKRFVQVVEEEITLFSSFALGRMRAFRAWLAPIRRLQKLRQLSVRSLPYSFRLWWCLRLVEHETEPEHWSYMLRFLANKHLGLPPQESLERLGAHIASFHPHADPDEMRRLMQELDGNLYSDGGIEFEQWKKAFRRQLRPSLLPKRRPRRRSARRHRLPALNPGTAV
jgi:hypothetical protein